MKKFLNFRLLTALAISIICGTVACHFRPTVGNYGFLILIGLCLSGFLLSEILFKATPRLKRAVVAAACLFFALCGYGRLLIAAETFKAENAPSGEYTVTGTVREVSKTSSGLKVIMKDCLYDGERGGDLVVYGLESVAADDIITVKGKVYPLPAEQGGKYSYYLLQNISAAGYDVSLVSVDGNAGGVFHAVRSGIKSVLLKEGGTSPDVALAVVIGDASRLDEEEKNNFRLTGIAHIFAVSGMHVGLLFLSLSFVFRFIKIKRGIKSAIIFLALAFYSGVCGFSASSLRAALMCGAYLFARSIGEKPDGVNALSLAAAIVALISPTDVLGVGYILSFTVSLSILAVSPPIRRKTAFLGEKFSLAFAVLIAAELAAFPISVIYFGYFPTVALIANLLFIPIITATYYLLWAGIIIDLILPFLSVGLILPYLVFDGIYALTSILSASPTLTVFPKFCLAAYYIAIFIASDLVNAGKAVKRVCVGAVAAVIFICVILN
ncbi:MAG: ComEC/Rec2 family competence protein [Clostridia bacterium]|nr:ComEC/Rec2 family competence protein [Clostridia bacterium]